MYTTLSSKGQVTMPVETRSVLRLDAGGRIDLLVFDKGRVEMLPKKGFASALKGLIKWRGKPATLSQMEEAMAREVCK